MTDLSKMGSRLPDEKEQPLREKRHSKSFQTLPEPVQTKRKHKHGAGCTFAADNKRRQQMEEEKSEILLLRVLVLQKEKSLEDMQMKLWQLEELLKHQERTGLPQGDNDNSPSSPDSQTDMVTQTQNSTVDYTKKFCFSLGKSLWMIVKLVLYSCSVLVAVGGIIRLLNRYSNQYYRYCPWPH